jgi:hypothetical protein
LIIGYGSLSVKGCVAALGKINNSKTSIGHTLLQYDGY